MIRLKHLLVLMLMALPVTTWANDDSGLIAGVAVEKKINKKSSVEAEVELRTRNHFRTIDRFSIGVSAEYKLLKWLKVDAGYQLLIDNNREKISYNLPNPIEDDEGKMVPNYNNWRPSYWATRHRVFASLTGSYKFGRVNFSLRERYRYTYRPQHSTTRYDFDNQYWEDDDIKSKHSHMLRSRLKLSWDIPKCKFSPWASAELFNNLSLDKVRYIAGVDYTLKKTHTFSAYYRYQRVYSDDETEPNCHSMGLSYKFKF